MPGQQRAYTLNTPNTTANQVGQHHAPTNPGAGSSHGTANSNVLANRPPEPPKLYPPQGRTAAPASHIRPPHAQPGSGTTAHQTHPQSALPILSKPREQLQQFQFHKPQPQSAAPQQPAPPMPGPPPARPGNFVHQGQRPQGAVHAGAAAVRPQPPVPRGPQPLPQQSENRAPNAPAPVYSAGIKRQGSFSGPSGPSGPPWGGPDSFGREDSAPSSGGGGVGSASGGMPIAYDPQQQQQQGATCSPSDQAASPSPYQYPGAISKRPKVEVSTG
ncbi:hypothetical protein HK405_013127 [Cladochytrium tenue]|nr:hypothetical protein HK405_013127 [Cladochytrium tenue]